MHMVRGSLSDYNYKQFCYYPHLGQPVVDGGNFSNFLGGGGGECAPASPLPSGKLHLSMVVTAAIFFLPEVSNDDATL